MRRVLVALFAAGMAELSGAADRPRPPGAAAAPSLIEHEFEPWTYSNGTVVCIYWDPIRRRTCDRPESEHASAQVGGEPVEDGEGVGTDGGQVE
jgi:hypothetical protein